MEKIKIGCGKCDGKNYQLYLQIDGKRINQLLYCKGCKRCLGELVGYIAD